MSKFFMLLSMILVSFQTVNSQSGTIRGKISDADIGEPLIGATVQIEGTTNGGVTDLDGNYTIMNVAAGSHNLIVSYIGYQSKTITGVEVIAGEVTIINASISEDVQMLDDEAVVVTAEALKDSEAGILTAQKKALQVVDGMGAEQFSRGSDSDAGSAIKRITGVSVEGGKYVYVRGLGDRYSKTSLNGADIPGLDPNRNTVQMDLFPTNLIDNIMVYKTFTPNLPGDFTGGYVNIETKDFPERLTIQFSSKIGLNPQAHFTDNFLTHEGGSLDLLGINDGSRDIPDIINNNEVPGISGISTSERELLYAMGQSFQLEQMDVSPSSKLFNQSHKFSIGDQKTLFGKPFGYIAGVSYQLNHMNYEDGYTGRYTLPGQGSTSLITQLRLDDHRSTESILWGAFANLSMKLSNNDKISLTAMRNQSADKTSRAQVGEKPEDSEDFNYNTRALMFQERYINSFQLKGAHVAENLAKLKIDWISSYTIAHQNEPDLRFFTYGYYFPAPGNEDGFYQIEPSIGQLPTRYFRRMEEGHLDNKIHFTLPLGENASSGNLRFGGSYVIKNRAFREEQYRYSSIPTPPSFFNGQPNDYITTGLLAPEDTEGSFITDDFQPANSYDANQTIGAAYAMVEKNIGEKLRLIAGARFETTDLFIESFDDEDEPGSLDVGNLLPSLNGTYSVSDDIAFKFGYNRTIARPTFRELATFVSFDFIGDYLLAGNPELRQTTIDNVDLRWEMYSRPGEIFAVSGFYKNFIDPIEKTFNVAAANGNELTWRNTPQATVIGVEAEFRKRLDFISSSLLNFTAGANFTYVYSNVDIDTAELKIIRAYNPEAPDTRQMFGQSPYIINAFLSYDDFEDWQANLTYFISGDRLSVVTAGGTPNVIERARGVLNFNISKNVGKFNLQFSANNLLNPEYKFTQTFIDTEFIFQNYRIGRTYSLGLSYRLNP